MAIRRSMVKRSSFAVRMREKSAAAMPVASSALRTVILRTSRTLMICAARTASRCSASASAQPLGRKGGKRLPSLSPRRTSTVAYAPPAICRRRADQHSSTCPGSYRLDSACLHLLRSASRHLHVARTRGPHPPMTKPLLFTPITIREVTLKNRVVIAPMATYSAVDGIAQDFHFAHWGRLVLGGAGVRVRRGHRGDRPGPHHQRRSRHLVGRAHPAARSASPRS